jgi:light-regulated signal transduction histidine kinase (bacteriophytochrome)
VDLNHVMSECQLNLAVAILEADADIVPAPDLPTVEGWPSELIRLFQNLIANAIKYRAPHRRPHVAVDARVDGNEAIIAIKDNGIGIDPKDHDRAFAIFQRLVAREDYEGTGIGLAIVKKIVTRHRGRVWIDSALGVGSTFYVALPLAGLKQDFRMPPTHGVIGNIGKP